MMLSFRCLAEAQLDRHPKLARDETDSERSGKAPIWPMVGKISEEAVPITEKELTVVPGRLPDSPKLLRK